MSSPAVPRPPRVPGALGDAPTIADWLAGQRNELTAAAYRAELTSFCAFVADKPMAQWTVSDIRAWLDDRGGAPATRAKRLAVLKAVMRYAELARHIPHNPAALIMMPTVANVLAERWLSQEQVRRLLDLETEPRNHALILLLYKAGLRVSEACALKWRHCAPRYPDGGQIAVTGKRNKVRYVLLRESVWAKLNDLKGNLGPDAAVFLSCRGLGGHLTASQVQRIVKRAAVRAGLPPAVSPHWLRHAHCSHALEANVSIAVVRDTVGHSNLNTTSRYAHSRPDVSSSLFLPD
jgi:integrase/recombinase XerD